ncbi:hypothetical protein [Streptomyces sp. NPDC002547]
MSARDEAVEMVRRICPPHLSADGYGQLLGEKFDAYRVEVVAERDMEIVRWLGKKAREYRSTGSRQHALQADAVEAMASKIARGAVRPNNTRLPSGVAPTFFEVGHTYGSQGESWKFRVDSITEHPEDGERTALGWRYWNGQWDAIAYGEDDWEIHLAVGLEDITGDGAE